MSAETVNAYAARSAAAPTHSRVLCVDLDGTLIATDLLWESLLSAIRRQPWLLFALPIWLIRGRSHLKHQLAEAATIDFANLPYREHTIRFLTEERARGRRIVLATAASRRLAHGVAEHLALFDEVLCSDAAVNFKGAVKAKSLVGRFGAKQFDYVGDSRADVACWGCAEEALTVGAIPLRRVAHLRVLPPATSRGLSMVRLRAIVRAMRPHQWLKNALLIVPAIAGHRLESSVLVTLAVAFASLSLCASGGYVLNDLLDLEADRRHARKRHRPFASGLLSVPTGMLLIAAAWSLGFGIAVSLLPQAFAVVMAIYLVATAAYSLHIKKEAVLDVMFLAGLYVLRVIAGGIAIGVQPSTWLLTFTLFVCLSLAFLKRYIEARSDVAQLASVVHGRGYRPDDAVWLQAAGLAAAYLSVVVLAIYVNSDDVRAMYSNPERLLLLCPVLLYWGTRVWHDAHRRRIHDDPLVAVASDRGTYVMLTISALAVLSAV